MRFHTLLIVALLPVFATAWLPRAPQSSQTATVSGVVHDSIASKRLPGALVQLVSVDNRPHFGRTVTSDSLGRFAFSEVPDGQYALGFFHPVLDSLGLDPLARAVTIDSQRSVRANLGVPSTERLRAAICGPTTPENSGALVMGVVRNARDRSPVAGVTVSGEWSELSLGKGGWTRRTPRRLSTTKENGWYAICNAPNPGTMVLMARRGADSTDFVDVQVPAGGFLRHELYLGVARSVTIADTTVRAGTVAPPPRRLLSGDGRLSGTVVASEGGRPLPGAQVSIVNGPQVRANARGEWTLADAPEGTRTLEVRAVGYYPERRAIDVVDGTAPVNVALVTFKSVLETVKISANYLRYSNLAGFRERQRTSVGQFITAADIARRQPITTSDLFRMVSGVYVDRDTEGDATILMRGVFEERCSPAVYIDGSYLSVLNASNLDSFVSPNEIAAIEVYSPTQVPAQFQPGLSGCGSIVIWTR